MSKAVETIEEVRDVIIAKFKSKSFFKKFVAEINDSVDVPMLNEKTEAKVLKTITKSFIKVLKNIDFGEEDEFEEGMSDEEEPCQS
jgi:hypothetical protein